MKHQTSQEALDSSLAALKLIGKVDIFSRNYAVAEVSLHTDLGYVGEHKNYDLDEHTRDRLIAHARQDSAHALVNTNTILREILILKRIFCLSFLMIVTLLILIYLR